MFDLLIETSDIVFINILFKIHVHRLQYREAYFCLLTFFENLGPSRYLMDLWAVTSRDVVTSRLRDIRHQLWPARKDI